MTITTNGSANYQPVRNSRKRCTRKPEISNYERFRYQYHYSLNSLWSVWYGIIAVAFQIYMVVKSVKRFTNYVSLEWPNDQPPYKELNTYVILTGIGVVFLPFFFVSSMMKIGNNSNDGRKLGDEKRSNEDHEAVYENINYSPESEKKNKRLRWLKVVWKHSIPTMAFLHTLAAICFLTSRLLMDAQIIKYGFLAKENIWKTEIDFFVHHFENKKTSFSDILGPTNETNTIAIGKGMFADNSNGDSLIRKNEMRAKLDLQPEKFSCEYVNLLFALLVNAVRYPSVFWKVSKSFGLLFSIVLAVNALLTLISFSSFTVLYKIQVFGPEKILERYPNKLSLDSTQSLVLFVAYLILVTLSSCALYFYGFNKYEERRKSTFIKFHITSNKRSPLLWGYCPHFSAFISLMAIAFCGIPLLYDLVMVHCRTSDITLLLGATCIACHTILWILLWIFLTFKHNWKFSSSFQSSKTKINGSEQTKPLMKGEPPLLIIQNGRTFQIRENTSKKAIINLVHDLLPSPKSLQSPNSNEDIYWLKPRPPSPVEDANSKSETCSLSWLRSKKKGDANKKTNSLTHKASLNKNKKKNSKSKKSNSIEVDADNSDDPDYTTFREIVQRDETDENMANSAHLKLCSLADNSCVETRHNATNVNGDYEVFMDSSTVPNNSVIYSYSEEKQSSSYSKNTVPHNDADNLTPCSGSLSESSTSPEKSSETSSGVHSNSSSSTGKRSNSVENLLQLMGSRHAWKSHSLQRYISSVDRPQRVVCITNDTNSMNSGNSVRRLRPYTQLEMSGNIATNIYGRIPSRMTSFAEKSEFCDYIKNGSVNSNTTNTTNFFPNCVSNDDEVLRNLHNSNEVNVDTGSSAIAMMYKHRRQDSANFSVASSDGDSNTQKI